MMLKLLDWSGEPVYVDIGDLKNVASISIEIFDGDEVAYVVYKDYTIKRFDSCNISKIGEFGGFYEIYRFDKTDNLIDDEEFKNRTHSEWMVWKS